MDIPIERTVVEACVNAISLQAEKETISIEREWLWGIVDRLNGVLQKGDNVTRTSDL